jgi:hypothetical protein
LRREQIRISEFESREAVCGSQRGRITLTDIHFKIAARAVLLYAERRVTGCTSFGNEFGMSHRLRMQIQKRCGVQRRTKTFTRHIRVRTQTLLAHGFCSRYIYTAASFRPPAPRRHRLQQKAAAAACCYTMRNEPTQRNTSVSWFYKPIVGVGGVAAVGTYPWT